MSNVKALRSPLTSNTLVDDFIAAKEREGKSKRYLEDLRSQLGRFAHEFEGRTMSDIATDEISEWLHDLRVSPTTEVNCRRIIVRAFNFAQKRGFVQINAATESEKVKVIPRVCLITVSPCCF